jgi:ribosomal protein S18 acetylase RimI-like enzyme
VRPLEWETAFFGAKLGELVVTERAPDAGALAQELRNTLREAELDGYSHLTFRASADDFVAVWAAERAGLRLMDVAVDLIFRLEATPLPTAPQRLVRPGSRADLPAMRAMTRGAFGLTRFAVDPFFTTEAVDHFYETWSINLFNGLADHVVITDIEGRPAGFIGCKLNAGGDGRIPLVATSSQFRRCGVARDLLSAALAWFARAGASVAYVKTQAANTPAVSLYERAGFTAHRTELAFTTTI